MEDRGSNRRNRPSELLHHTASSFKHDFKNDFLFRSQCAKQRNQMQSGYDEDARFSFQRRFQLRLQVRTSERILQVLAVGES